MGDLPNLTTNRNDDLEPYCHDENDWLRIVEFLPTIILICRRVRRVPGRSAMKISRTDGSGPGLSGRDFGNCVQGFLV